jgi:hypothetical protein
MPGFVKMIWKSIDCRTAFGAKVYAFLLKEPLDNLLMGGDEMYWPRTPAGTDLIENPLPAIRANRPS